MYGAWLEVGARLLEGSWLVGFRVKSIILLVSFIRLLLRTSSCSMDVT